ncbi:MAG: OmpA family protein [Polyangiaceae bacterium]|nr:OmpA family protein [Polyangiaceae bacterium]
MRLMRTASLAWILTAASVSSPAFAQSSGFALNRFEPSERGSDWFSVESLDLRGDNRLGAGVVGDWAYKPMVLYDRDGDEVSALVEHQLFVHLGANWVFADRLRFAFSIPVLLLNTGDAVDEGTNLGDLRFGGDLRFFGEYGDAITMAGGLQLHLPTGSQDAFTGDGKVRVAPRLLAAGDIGPFTYAGHIGVNFRSRHEDFAGEPFGTELLFAAAAGVRSSDGKLTVGPELYGSTVVSDGGNGMFDRRTTPFELMAGAHYRVGDAWRLGAGMGPGITRGVGAPQFRVLANIEWFPDVAKEPAPPPDMDGDGILDRDDACPTVPGLASDDPSKHGCPPPADRDNDGVPDELDACPDEAGVATADPRTNGCPPPKDRDGDGIEDSRDACPDEPGVVNDDPKKNGCPAPKDRDGDGILDDQDACPDVAGTANLADPKKHGCPKAQIVGTQIQILDRVEFDTNKATLRAESDPVLNAVQAILQAHPEIIKVVVQGHTDNRGTAAHNLGLSRRRAAAVAQWLVDHGIDRERLTSEGLGLTKPIDTNDTEEGRQNNRRVEFHINARNEPADAAK